ncbi:MAG: M20/M25/M40 family metallo-hydrolase [Candidatus Dadabacteria bacterium]|nr:MAG: M20/M25/M40 family metallo-hydrolase [Candidatus Dadabacteria bacterium]
MLTPRDERSSENLDAGRQLEQGQSGDIIHHKAISELFKLAPQRTHTLWRSFTDLTQIPRPSGHEQQVREYVKELARQHNWQVQVDKAGNIALDLPGRGKGKNQKEGVILQAHMDMVPAASFINGVDETLDYFKNNPLKLLVAEEDYYQDGTAVPVLKAQGTSLGADDGIGVAAALAVALEAKDHPPLKLLFTVKEEIGLQGAKELDPALIDDTAEVNFSKMISLDIGRSDGIRLGAAGGRDMIISLRPQRETPPVGYVPVRLTVDGIESADRHSGLDIHKPHVNPIQEAARAVLFEIEAGSDIRLAGIVGGSSRNSIPRECELVFFCKEAEKDRIVKEVTNQSRWHGLSSTIEPGIRVSLEEVQDLSKALHQKPVNANDTVELLKFISEIPEGVQSWTAPLKGIKAPELSNNLGTVQTLADRYGTIKLDLMSRSFDVALIDGLQKRIEVRVLRSGLSTEVEFVNAYGAWKPDAESDLFKVARRLFTDMRGSAPEVIVQHSGLEAGVISGIKPGLEVIAIGPDIDGHHTPGERVVISSVTEFQDLLNGILSKLC